MVGPIDADWYCEQVEQFKPTMFRVAYAILHCEADCEDAASSAVLRGYRYLSTLQSRDGFRSWMLRILKNECFNILYRRQLFEPMPAAGFSALEFAKAEPMPAAEPVELQAPDIDLQRAFARLPARARLALTLHYYEGYSVQEIAAILGEPAGTVKSRMARARERLKKELEQGG